MGDCVAWKARCKFTLRDLAIVRLHFGSFSFFLVEDEIPPFRSFSSALTYDREQIFSSVDSFEQNDGEEALQIRIFRIKMLQFPSDLPLTGSNRSAPKER